MANKTAKEIATALGVSPAAVSLAINGKPGVSDKTRAKILAACQEAGFAMGSAVVPAVVENQGTTKTLCFMIFVDELLNILENSTFYAFNMQGVEAAASINGYNTLVRYLQKDAILSRENLAFLKTLDGLILLGTDITAGTAPAIRTMLDTIPNVPKVVLDTMMLADCVDCVGNDNFGGAYQAVTHLISQGCRQIAYLCARSRIPNFNERESGVLAALKKADLPLFSKIQCSIGNEEAYRDILAWIHAGNVMPDAIFAENDVLAVAACRAMHVCGIQIPQQVSIIGFDNLPITEQTNPPLTTMHSYKDDLGATAVGMMLHRQRMNGYCNGRDTGFLKVQMTTPLVMRKSVRNTF